MNPRHRSLAAILTVAVGLAGCVASGPMTRHYQLEPVASRVAREPGARPITIVVREVRLPIYLDRPEIVTRDSGHRIRLAESDHWGGDLREDLTRVLVQNMGRLLEGDRVFAAPIGVTVQPDYRLEVEILGFERDAGGQVRLDARWWLARGSDMSLIATEQAALSAATATDSYPDLVASMNTIVADLSRLIAVKVSKLGGS